MIQQQAKTYLQPANPNPATMSAEDAQKAIATDLATYAGGGADAAAAKERVITIMAAQMKIGHDEAAKQFDDVQAKLKQARDEAIRTAENAADAERSRSVKDVVCSFWCSAARFDRRRNRRFARRPAAADCHPSNARSRGRSNVADSDMIDELRIRRKKGK